MLLTILIAVAITLVVVAGLWFGLAFAMRRPTIARRMMRVPPLRWLMARVTRAGLRSARKKAQREGRLPTDRPVSDLEVALAASDTEEARRARAMLARMTPRQRAELSRRTMGADGLAGLMGDNPLMGLDDEDALGRTGRRRGAGVAASPGRDTARAVQQRKAVAKRRAARKKSRR